MAKRAFVFFVLLAWCGFLLAGRVWLSHQLTYAFLAWNLFLADVQEAMARRFGAFAGWAIAISALLLSGFGAYLGRFLRWNSWEPIANPSELLNRLGGYGLNPMSHPRSVAVTFVYGVCFALGYAALHVIGTTTMRSR